ncbi:methyl-accepting chemotaxis protein [Thioalkalivibrio sulfidiphilus]|uniref:methyl-accepting chemotaxis protein n=1 Tax=Thioalkalivibrio sulfidiphilus TaxID=1033854 RepID=UPI00036794CF|nr:methyl-accepting chemotaxis protein [Thioalkalivibrio sulfidiphilus]
MGNDPLAWLQDAPDAAPAVTTAPKPVERRKRARRKSDISREQPEGLAVDALERSFELLADQGEALVARFYARLFQDHPAVRRLFDNTTPAEQQRKLLAALKLVINNLRKPEALQKVLRELGARHQGYGALPAHYGAVATTLREVMAELAGDAWNEEFDNAWRSALTAIGEIMLSAYGTTEDGTMVASKKVMEEQVAGADVAAELNRMRSAVDGAMTAIMMVDRDLVITYANKSTIELLGRNQAELRKIYPGFDVNKLVGTCIDDFHANPAHQRRLLEDPANLPYRTDIQVGSLRFNLNVTAIMDAQGNYIGNTLEWSDVTEERRKEREVARLQSAIDGSTSNIMMCDDDLNIVYVNPAVMAMFRKRAAELRQAFPGFDPENLLGQNIDKFHKNPAHQRALLKDPNRLPAKAEIKVLDLEFEVNATYVSGPNGEYMGNMVEWKDITEMKDAERQIRDLVAGAARGEFSNRIDTGKYQGFFQQLGELLNDLMDISEKGLTDVAEVIRRLAQGDLTGSIDAEYHGLFGQLKEDVNGTVENLRNTVEQIREGATSISTSASEISQGNTDLSQRTEEQASSLEETASSMEEMTSAVKSSADNARQANQLAAGARDQAERGGEVVGQAVAAMAEINSASKKIADIISVIDEIAFQTNLLALNAAVEAARAGEQGRGFAVVAAEVRNLAQRSAQAAKEIKSLIKDSVEKVEDGSRLVGDSGKTLEEIVTAVKKVSDIIAEIAAAAQEQSAGIEQVNKAVTQLDEVTQQNAALVEQAAASSEALDEQARALTELMAFFHTGEVEPAPRMPAARQAQARQAPARQAAGRPATPARPAQRSAPAPRARTRPVPQDQGEDWEEF